MENCTSIAANPDVAGVGVRVSIYIQSFLTQVPLVLALVLSKGNYCPEPERLASIQASRYAILTTGFGLLISAVVQARAYHLTVYHALIMLNLTWIITITAWSSAWFFLVMEPAYMPDTDSITTRDQTTIRSAIVKSVTTTVLPGLTFDHPRYGLEKEQLSSSLSWGWTCTAHMTFMSAMGLWVFINIAQFDSKTPECTFATTYPVFGHQIESTSKHLRTFWLLIYHIGVLPFMNVIFLLCIKGPLQILISLLVSSFWRVPLQSFSERPHRSALPLHIMFALHPFGISEIFTTTIFNCIFIASTENMISRNKVQLGENQWTFGQTLSLFLAVPGIWAVWRDIRATRKRWKEQLQAKDMELLPLQGPACPPERPEKAILPESTVTSGRLSAWAAPRRPHSV